MKRIVMTIVAVAMTVISAQAQEKERYMVITKTSTVKIPVSDVEDITFREEEMSEKISVNGVEFTMIKVDGGTFLMGSNDPNIKWADPVHRVTLGDYYIGETEVTKELWAAVMGTSSTSKQPVEQTYGSCGGFISKLNELTGLQFRLPTEAEWEFAAKGGIKSKGYIYSGSDTIDDVAWYDGNSNSKTHVVATKAPNELGIYDMSGNVAEWCADWFNNYIAAPQISPIGPFEGSQRIVRGGSYKKTSDNCSTVFRDAIEPKSSVYNQAGFRIAL